LAPPLHRLTSSRKGENLMFQRDHTTSVILIIAGIFIASNLYTMLPIQTILVEKYDITLELTALSSFFYIFFYACGLICFGMLSDLYGERRTILTGMLCLSLLTLCLSFLSNYFLFVVGRAIQGFLAASFAPPAFSYIFRYFQGKLLTLTIALINTGFLFAGIFGQIVSFHYVFTYSFSTLFYAFCLLYFICYVLLFLTLKYTKISTTSKKSLTFILTFYRHLSLKKLYITTFFLLLTVMYFYGSLEVYLLTENKHFSMSLQTFRTIGLIGIIPAVFANFFVGHFGAKRTLMGSLLLMSVGFLFSIFSLSEEMILISAIFMIASTSLTIPMVILLIGNFVEEKHRGRALSVYSFTLLIGGSIGSVLAANIPFYAGLIATTILFLCLTVYLFSLKTEKDK
jgi:MFS transporter, YNFM family, putative membrane transport protein